MQRFGQYVLHELEPELLAWLNAQCPRVATSATLGCSRPAGRVDKRTVAFPFRRRSPPSRGSARESSAARRPPGRPEANLRD